VQLSVDDQQLLSCTYSLHFGVDRCENSRLEGANGVVVETGIADAILQV
jgi:hypothetical protein